VIIVWANTLVTCQIGCQIVVLGSPYQRRLGKRTNQGWTGGTHDHPSKFLKSMSTLSTSFETGPKMKRATVDKLSNRNRWTQVKDHGDALSWCMKSVCRNREFASLAVSTDHAVHFCLNNKRRWRNWIKTGHTKIQLPKISSPASPWAWQQACALKFEALKKLINPLSLLKGTGIYPKVPWWNPDRQSMLLYV